jgi:hypothetical protein
MEHPVVLQNYSSRALAELAKSKLRASGVDSVVMVDDAGGQYPGLGMARGAELVVESRELKRAKKVLGL